MNYSFTQNYWITQKRCPALEWRDTILPPKNMCTSTVLSLWCWFLYSP